VRTWQITPSANRKTVLIENNDTGQAWVVSRQKWVGDRVGDTTPDRLPEDRLIPWLAANAREMDPHELTEYALVDEQERVARRQAWEAKNAAKLVPPVKPPEPAMPAEWGTW